MSIRAKTHWRLWTVLLVGVGIGVGPVAIAKTLDQTAVGRFAAGNAVTSNTATQDLLAWRVQNTGRAVQIVMPDATGKAQNLGECGLDVLASQKIQNTVGHVGWTQLHNTYDAGKSHLDVRESLLTPVLWFQTGAAKLSLFKNAPGTKVLSVSFSGGQSAKQMTQPWFLAQVQVGKARIPVVGLVNHAPQAIRRNPDGSLSVIWAADGRAHALGLFPLFGIRPDTTARTVGWEQKLPATAVARITQLASVFYPVPTGMTEAYQVSEKAVTITDTLNFASQPDDWGWSRKRTAGYALVPPALSNAKRYGYPVSYGQPVTDLDYPTYTASLTVVPNSRTVTFHLPHPDLYGTMNTPFTDPTLTSLVPAAIPRTAQDYSKQIISYYKTADVDTSDSAVGDARSMASDYGAYPLMDTKAKSVFSQWADKAAPHMYSAKCYGYRKEAGRGERFLIDNYRVGGDFGDAGWFGYDPLAMWSRAHFGNKWPEIRAHWGLIKSLFYGWTWTYQDYATMEDPLNFSALNGGSDKGYEDNMGMFAAYYAYARMADHLGDQAMLRDTLYMLSRDTVSRYNRMSIYNYTKSCGFQTDTPWLVSDMGNGLNIAFTGKYIPPKSASSQWRTGNMVDFGPYQGGLWFTSGSFLEPVTPATTALINISTMKAWVAQTEAIYDLRFIRWYANPYAGETANYQIYLRGTVLHEDPTLLRYKFDYQDGFGQGVWWAPGWHADAYAGICLSPFYGIEHRGQIAVQVVNNGSLTPAKDQVEPNLLIAQDGSKVITLLNMTTRPLQVQVTLDSKRLGLPKLVRLAKLGRATEVAATKAQSRPSPTQISEQAVVTLTLAPGPNLYRVIGTAHPISAIAVQSPSRIVATSTLAQTFPITLHNSSHQARKITVTTQGFTLEGQGHSISTLAPGKTWTLTGLYYAPEQCGMPVPLSYTVTADGATQTYRLHALTLPAVTALMDLPTEKVAFVPQVGSLHLALSSHLPKDETLHLKWSLNGKEVETQDLTLQARKVQSMDIPLRTEQAVSGQNHLIVTLSSDHLPPVTATRDVVLIGPKTPGETQSVVFADFESGVQGWGQTDWPDANKDAHGKIFKPVSSSAQAFAGHSSLQAMFRFVDGKPTQGFVSAFPDADWTFARHAQIQVYLPANAPSNITAMLFMMGDDWRWRVMTKSVTLKPGEWTTVEAVFEGSGTQADWGQPESDIQAALKDVHEFGLRIFSDGKPGYTGPIYLDDFRLEVK